MPIVVVATMTAKPESVDTVRDACTQAIEAVHQEPGCELYSLHEADGTFIFVEQWADADALTAHSKRTAVGELFGTVGEHLDGAPTSRCCSRSSPEIPRRVRCVRNACARTAKSRSSPVPPAVRAAPRRSGWPPTARASSRSTSATRSPRCPIRWRHLTISLSRSNSSRTPVRESWRSRPTFVIKMP